MSSVPNGEIFHPPICTLTELLQDAAPDSGMGGTLPSLGVTEDGNTKPPDGYESWDMFFETNHELRAFLGDAAYDQGIAVDMQPAGLPSIGSQDTLADATYTLPAEEEGSGERVHGERPPDQPIGTLRQRDLPTKAQKAASKDTSKRNQEARKRIEADVVVMLAVRAKEDRALALKHGLSVERIREVIGAAPEDAAHVRKPNVGNGLVKRALQEMNEYRPAGSKANLTEVRKLMKGNPAWDSSLLTEEEKEEIRREILESREYKAFAARPTDRSAAKTCAELLKVVETKVKTMNAKCSLLGVSLFTRSSLESSIRPALMSSPEAYDFFMDVLKLDLTDLLLMFEQWACARRPGIVNETYSSLRDDVVRFMQKTLDLITGSGSKKIHMSYTNFVVDILQKHKIKLIGWPAGLEFRNPRRYGSLDDLRRIVHQYKTGNMYWVHLTPSEIRTMKANWQTKEKRATRSDAGGKHNVAKAAAATATAKKTSKRKTNSAAKESGSNKRVRAGDGL